MGSMVMSTFMMFVPRYVEFIFLAVLCVGFFGIYIPYNESKKKGKVWPPLGWLRRIRSMTSRREKPARPVNRRLAQLESLRTAGIISEKEYKERRKKMEEEL